MTGAGAGAKANPCDAGSAMQTHLKRMPTQRLIFWSVALLLLSQVAWWISLQVRETRRLQDAKIATLKASRAEAWQMDSSRVIKLLNRIETVLRGRVVEGEVPQLPSLAERRQAIEQQFPYVAVVPQPIAEDDPPLLDQVAYITLRQEPLQALAIERRQALWRVGIQGSIFAFGVLLGFTYFYRRLNAETDLALRQRNFMATVTHELKTPIASLRVWMETMFTHSLAEDRRTRIHTLMDKDLERLTELVTNLLDAARADAGSLDLKLEPIEVAPWLQGVCEGMDQRLGAGTLGLTLNLEQNLWTLGDVKALSTVVENLLSNACKYANDPRHTTVTLGQDRDWAILVISDQGMGIQSKDLPRLFERFFRVGDELTRAVPGTGLGLFLCKEIVLRHGGTIRAASRGPGLGSSFMVKLPRLHRTGPL
jgi:signal transduction histidine kinase